MIFSGTIQKLKGNLNPENGDIDYSFPIGQALLPLNDCLGKTLTFDFSGNIFCIHCGRKTKKSFQQGYCFVCATRLARCDICIVRPEKCHFHLGTCREPEWAQTHCMIPHIIYIANTSHIKVGITRATQIPGRWIDQGATQALKIAQVSKRHHAGLLEVQLAKQFHDKTDWRAMLRGENEPIDLQAKRQEICQTTTTLAESPIEWFPEEEGPLTLKYPILEYPKKIQSVSVEKQNNFSSTLLGIKGQYLILETGVINIRKISGYELNLSVAN